MADYILYIIAKAIIALMRFVPLGVWLGLANVLGTIYYFLAGRQNQKAYAHLKLAFGDKPRYELKRIIRQMYRRFAQSFMETLYLPYMDEAYIQAHVKISNMSVVREAAEGGHGILFLGAHAGSWELSNVACGLLFRDYHYAMLAQPQARTKRLDLLLNQVRETKGCSVISVGELKKMVEHLQHNYFLGLVADHGGKDGILVEFFGKLAPTPVGSVRLAKKLGSKIIVSYMRRIKGADHEMLFKPLELVSTSDAASDAAVNLRRINEILEGWITQYPQEYLWPYKRWKYSSQKDVLILSDGKRGHEKQSQALAEMISSLGFSVRSSQVECAYKNPILKTAVMLAGLFLGPRAVLWILPFCVQQGVYKKLMRRAYDIVISTGQSLVPLNDALAKENHAKSFVIMRPGIFGVRRFSFVVIPEHDHPPLRDNVAISLGALNTVTPEACARDFQELLALRPDLSCFKDSSKPKIGLLVGGDSKNCFFETGKIETVCGQIKKFLDEQDADLFLTTSRRTPLAVTAVLKKYFKDSLRCPFFIAANEDNPKGTVGGIFYLSDMIVVSGESISMVSESVASGKPVVVFEPIWKKQQGRACDFLDSLSRKKLITLVSENEIYDKLCGILREKPQRVSVDMKSRILEKLKKIL